MKTISLLLVLITSLAGFAAAGGGSGGTGSHGANLDLFATKPADSSKATPPAAPKLIEPSFKAVVTGTSTTLKWEASSGATAYHLQVATDPNFKWLMTDQWSLNATQFQINGLEKGRNYFWRVAGIKGSNMPGKIKGWFSTNTFTVK